MTRAWREGGKRPSAGLVLGKGISGVIVGDDLGDRKLDCVATLSSVIQAIYTPPHDAEERMGTHSLLVHNVTRIEIIEILAYEI